MFLVHLLNLMLPFAKACNLVVNHYSGYITGENHLKPDQASCENVCDSIFHNFGAEWRTDGHIECYCIHQSSIAEINNVYNFKVRCGIKVRDTEVTVGNTSQVRIVYNYKDRADDTNLEIFALDDLQNLTRSERFLIQEGQSLLDLPQETVLYKSNITNQYIGLHDYKDVTSERIAEAYFLEYKLGDVDLSHKPLWVNTIVGNSEELEMLLLKVNVTDSNKNNDMIVSMQYQQLGDNVCIWYNITTKDNSTSDIHNVSMVIQPMPGFMFKEMLYEENSRSWTTTVIEEKIQLFFLPRLSIDSFISFNVTFIADTKRVFVGTQHVYIFHAFFYTNYTDGVAQEQTREDHVESVVTRMPNNVSEVRPAKTETNQELSGFQMEDQFVVCAMTNRRPRQCLMLNSETNEITRLTSNMMNPVGYDTENLYLYGKDSSQNVFHASKGTLIYAQDVTSTLILVESINANELIFFPNSKSFLVNETGIYEANTAIRVIFTEL